MFRKIYCFIVYRHLPKAIQNAEKLGFVNGAALFPVATFNGGESYNEWELTFEEVHRNGVIAYSFTITFATQAITVILLTTVYAY